MNKGMLELGTAIIWAVVMVAYTIVADERITGNLALVFGGGFIAHLLLIRWHQSKAEKTEQTK